MSDIKVYLPLVQSLDLSTFATRVSLCFLVRQRQNEMVEGETTFQTPKQMPIPSVDEKTLQPTTVLRDSSKTVRALVIKTEEDLFSFFAVHAVRKTGRNSFSGVTIGRTQNNDVVVPVRTVSKFHAWISSEGGRFYCYDAQSSYGTSVDQVLLQGGERRPLDPGSKIYLGDPAGVALTFVDASGLHNWLSRRLGLIKR